MGMFKAAQDMAGDALAKARKEAQELTPTKETLVGNPRLGSGHPINVGLTTGSTTTDAGTEYTVTRLRGGLEADPSNVARAHFEEGDWATKLATGDKLPGEYVFGDTVVKSPKILQVGIDHPTAGQGFHTEAGFIPYSYLSESVETQGQRMERERTAKEAAKKAAAFKVFKDLAKPFHQYQRQAIVDPGDPTGKQKHVDDALDYAVDHGPYSGKDQGHIVKDKDIYKASEEDYENLVHTSELDPDEEAHTTREGIAEVASGTSEGMDWVVYEDEVGNKHSFVWTPDGVVNVTGHPKYSGEPPKGSFGAGEE
tara:strand:- start:885 stop:1817 length:933 start_codon:yes stop_codon:yes gene_type:complete